MTLLEGLLGQVMGVPGLEPERACALREESAGPLMPLGARFAPEHGVGRDGVHEVHAAVEVDAAPRQRREVGNLRLRQLARCLRERLAERGGALVGRFPGPRIVDLLLPHVGLDKREAFGSLLARAGGLVAHLLEESQRSIGFIMSHHADQAISYDGKPSAGKKG